MAIALSAAKQDTMSLQPHVDLALMRTVNNAMEVMFAADVRMDTTLTYLVILVSVHVLHCHYLFHQSM
jgi:hypothetical protein